MAFAKGGSVYILTNKNKTTLYTGVTSDLASRLREHLLGVYPKSFTARYNLKILVYMEHFPQLKRLFEEKRQ